MIQTEMKFQRNKSDYLDFFMYLVFSGTLFFSLGYYQIKKGSIFLSLLILLFVFREYLYKQIDFLITIRIISKESEVYVCFCFLQIKINLNNSFLIIEDKDYFGLTKNSTKYYLVLVRNDDKFFNRIFKNRIKLIQVTNYNLNVVKDKMNELHENFGLRKVDFTEEIH